MSSTFAGLNTMVRGLAAQQVSLDTVGHNVSNASTTGYSRQTVDLCTTSRNNLHHKQYCAKRYGCIGNVHH